LLLGSQELAQAFGHSVQGCSKGFISHEATTHEATTGAIAECSRMFAVTV
jgi:hypothetical protein